MNCWICTLVIELDDGAVPQAGGRCLCLRCWGRETGTSVRPSRRLVRAVEAVLAGAGAGG